MLNTTKMVTGQIIMQQHCPGCRAQRQQIEALRLEVAVMRRNVSQGRVRPAPPMAIGHGHILKSVRRIDLMGQGIETQQGQKVSFVKRLT